MTRAAVTINVCVVNLGGMDTTVQVLGFAGADARCRIIDGHFDSWRRAFVPGPDHHRELRVPADSLGKPRQMRIG